jgi:hypothetical protein
VVTLGHQRPALAEQFEALDARMSDQDKLPEG